MTKFNPQNKANLNYSECLDPAMKITDQEDADQYLKEYVQFIQNHLNNKPRSDDMKAEQIVKTNLAYYAGYGDDKLRARVESLFKCSHPIFGPIKENGTITTGAAFKAGIIQGLK